MLKIALIQMVQSEKTGRPEIGLGIAFIKAFLLQHEPNIDVDLFINDEKLEQFNPLRYDMIGISSVSFCFDEAKEIAKAIKEANADIPVLIGGAHITGLPQCIECDYFDIGMIGEGERTFLELARLYKRHKRFTPDILEDINGICFAKEGKTCFTGHREYIGSLDSIPHFDKNFLKETGALPYLIATRGCPFNCKYCNSNTAWQRKVRFHSADYIARDIMQIKEAFPDDDRVIFKDDNFTANKKMLEELREKIRAIDQIRGRRSRFIGSTHIKFITAELLKTLKSLNVIKINFGIETASDRLLKIIRKGITVAETQKVLDLCYEHKMDTGSSFLIGIPEESEDDLKSTYEFTLRNMQQGKLFTAGTNVLTPLPDINSEYWKLAVEKYKIDIHTFRWKRLDLRSFHAYHFQHNGNNSLNDWWEWRQKKEALYIGRLPEDKFLKVIEPYEKELIKYNEKNIKIDMARR